MEAMESEIQALQGNDTWDLVSPTPNASIIGSKWVYSIKLKSDGAIDRYKARLVAQGYKQEYEIDYEESLALVAKMNTTGFL